MYLLTICSKICRLLSVFAEYLCVWQHIYSEETQSSNIYMFVDITLWIMHYVNSSTNQKNKIRHLTSESRLTIIQPVHVLLTLIGTLLIDLFIGTDFKTP